MIDRTRSNIAIGHYYTGISAIFSSVFNICKKTLFHWIRTANQRVIWWLSKLSHAHSSIVKRKIMFTFTLADIWVILHWHVFKKEHTCTWKGLSTWYWFERWFKILNNSGTNWEWQQLLTGKVSRGVFSRVAKKFKVRVKTVCKIWKRYLQEGTYTPQMWHKKEDQNLPNLTKS